MTQRYPLAVIRDRTYKQKDAWWTVGLVDPLASRLVWLVQPWRSVTPNRLTTLAFLVGAVGAYCFWQASYPWLLLGALLFHLSFVLDCMDGKIARLNGTGSAFGSWLDYVLDRLRVAICAVGLFGGQYAATGNMTWLWVGAVVVFLDMFRYLNALQMGKVRADLNQGGAIMTDEDSETGPVVPAAMPPGNPSPIWRLRDFLVRHRIRPHLFSGIEFMMFVFIVGPVLQLTIPVAVLSSAVFVAFELLLIYRLYAYAKRKTAQNKREQAAAEAAAAATVAVAA
ncbi:CDP-alcohol phosphatidyltransferase family protein [Actinoplanes sp. LDG1-06]|uniref:CDP-alcohol phosphatidyltransferase family protein n=1 Tax=Paractinoplanes ovalisporus TaxID=2810368 RepID=A0ABS2AJC1_9ACTN|nr:CDP-alcohol phosphatidyltransferase family protein [Actinoplanes ovalisporus]MBM2619927.1 CDP-alcohol phosphatidyltransferase family protein [Actinoplanes ovalisporus]